MRRGRKDPRRPAGQLSHGDARSPALDGTGRVPELSLCNPASASSEFQAPCFVWRFYPESPPRKMYRRHLRRTLPLPWKLLKSSPHG